MTNTDCCIKHFSIWLCVLLAVLQLNTLFASPPQRLIIQFDTALSAEQTLVLTQQIKSILNSDFSVLPHSTEQRWIIIINPPLDASNLDSANAKISRLDHVQYVEPDQLIHTLKQDK